MTELAGGTMRFVSTIVAVFSVAALSGCNSSHLSAVAAGIDVSPETLTFAATLPGATNTKTATIKNNGGGVLSITALDIGGDTPAAFSTDVAASAFPLQLGASESLQVQVTFAPGETGPHAGVMTVHSSDPNRPAIDVQLVTAAL